MANIFTFVQNYVTKKPASIFVLYISFFRKNISIRVVEHVSEDSPKILVAKSYAFSSYTSEQSITHPLFSIYTNVLEYMSFHNNSLSECIISFHDELVDHTMEGIPMHRQTFVSYTANIPEKILRSVQRVFVSQYKNASEFLKIRTSVPVLHNNFFNTPNRREFVFIILKEEICELLIVQNSIPVFHEIVSHKLPHFLFKSRQNAVLDSNSKVYTKQISELFSYIYEILKNKDSSIICVAEGHVVSYLEKYAIVFNSTVEKSLFSVIDKHTLSLALDGTFRNTNDLVQGLEILTHDLELWQK